MRTVMLVVSCLAIAGYFTAAVLFIGGIVYEFPRGRAVFTWLARFVQSDLGFRSWGD